MRVVQGRLHSREQRRVLGGRRSQLLQGSRCPRTYEPVRIMQSRLQERRGHFRMPSCRCPDPPERLCGLCPHQFIPVMQGGYQPREHLRMLGDGLSDLPYRFRRSRAHVPVWVTQPLAEPLQEWRPLQVPIDLSQRGHLDERHIARGQPRGHDGQPTGERQTCGHRKQPDVDQEVLLESVAPAVEQRRARHHADTRRRHDKDGIFGAHMQESLAEARDERGDHQPEDGADRPLDHRQGDHPIAHDEMPDVLDVLPHTLNRLALAGGHRWVVHAAAARQRPDQGAAQHDRRRHADKQAVDPDDLGQQRAQNNQPAKL